VLCQCVRILFYECVVNYGEELELADVAQFFSFFRKKKLEEEEAEVKRKATDAAYQGELSLVLLLALTMWFCVLMTALEECDDHCSMES
jgi:hypothetical protein